MPASVSFATLVCLSRVINTVKHCSTCIILSVSVGKIKGTFLLPIDQYEMLLMCYIYPYRYSAFNVVYNACSFDVLDCI